MFVVNSELINEMIKVDEEILETMRDILNAQSDSNEILLDEYYDYLRMFINREQRIISKIPKDADFINYIRKNLNNFISAQLVNPDNLGRITSRMTTFFNSFSSLIKPSEKYVQMYVDNKVEQYDLEEEYNQKQIYINYSKILMERYLKSLEDMKSLGIYDNDKLLAVQFLNIFIYGDICLQYSKNGFNIDKLEPISDSKFIKDNQLDNQNFLYLKHEEILSNILVLISLILNNEVDSIDYLDAELNFKYLLCELSYEELIELNERIDDIFNNIVEKLSERQIDIISSLNAYVEKECNRKELLESNEIISYDSLSDENHDKLVNLVNFERKFLEKFDELKFSSNDDIDLIENLERFLNLENDFVNNIDFNSVLLTDFNQFLNLELKKILNQDYSDREFRLISYRIGYLFPQFSSLFVSPSQSTKSYDMILRNYLADTLNVFYDLISIMDDGDIKDDYFQLYKDRFFIFPIFTKELISFKGNSRMIDSVSDDFIMDVAGIEEIELYYDINEQLFPEAKKIIEEFSDFDLSYLGSSYCQYRIIQFDYIVRLLSTEYLELLSDMLSNQKNFEDAFRAIFSEMLYSNLVDVDYNLNVSFDKDKVLFKIIKNSNI